jgi:hypothetical protein
MSRSSVVGRRGRRRRLDALELAQADRNVRAAGHSSVGPGDRLGGAADLSRAASDLRRTLVAKGDPDGGATGKLLTERAIRVFDRAKLLQKTSDRAPAGRRRRRASDQADQALVTAAMQIRLAQATPLDRGYLHHHPLERIQEVRAEVTAIAARDLAALAVDTHRRIRDQRIRCKQEGVVLDA